ncbi:micronuclear linker histone polyprotein-like [Olea europaea var. sylvestris]|uniref:micronuclear linker histone polyprotein-like n=1 Tax=Olea europaea var. sylvestris TaxID=158386 RepID=UPI000C1CCEFC|nr:micronuclear linker histone polyprotein-like [Olea europaea var. sylvestris]
MEADKYGRTRENKYVSRKSSFDEASEEEEDDDEIRYLQKLKTSRMSASHNTEHGVEPRSQKLRRISGVMDRDLDGYDVGVRDYNISSSGKESKKPRPDRISEDTDYAEDEESVSDGELETKNKKQLKESFEVSVSSKGERAITTRRQALQKGRDISMSSDANFIEFPNGLPPAPPRKQKEKLSEMEHQLKRAEAAQRRRIQNEKAARESEAEAIRKILGQDSSRKRREEKIKKRKEQLAQERAANATVASNVVRWVMGPSGTTVTFPDDIGLPSIFESKHSSYPPPREKCAGPSCTNAYKYRDSESNLPLCSLQCYKAIHEKTRPLSACRVLVSGVMDRDLDGYDVGVRDYNISSSGKESKKPRPDRISEDTDYAEDEESVSDGELETKNKKQLKESFEVSVSSKGERAITTRRQALQKGRDISMSLDANFIEFPNGLPPAPPRKQKEKLSEMEHQLKRAEAAQRRRIQNEKAARESEAEAIRKILGQDSSRKRREEKIKKRKEQLAQERAANATVASNVVRWVMGPSGTTVTFPDDIGLPSIFESKHSSYPPPREKCAGPSCTNAYKYRDSESNLPLCSLQCYKAIHEKTRPLSAC